jgi:hypothetical protein
LCHFDQPQDILLPARVRDMLRALEVGRDDGGAMLDEQLGRRLADPRSGTGDGRSPCLRARGDGGFSFSTLIG